MTQKEVRETFPESHRTPREPLQISNFRKPLKAEPTLFVFERVGHFYEFTELNSATKFPSRLESLASQKTSSS